MDKPKTARGNAPAKPRAVAPRPAPKLPVVAASPVSAPAAPVSPPAEVPAPPMPAAIAVAPPEKDMDMDTSTVETQAKTMIADVQARTQDATDKGQKMFADASEFGKGNIEALVESGKIAIKGIETMTQDAAAYAKSQFEEATTAMKTLGSVKSPTDFFKLQGDYARAAFESMIAQSSRSTEAVMKLVGEVAQPIQNRVAIATDKVKVAA